MKNDIAICTLEISAAGPRLQLLPAGEFAARDGRPGPGRRWRLSAQEAARLVAQASARRTPYVVDYEHQTLNSEHNGQPAPAAGWFKTLEWREDGLFAVDVDWTAKARAMIEAGEYRFISPVFSYDEQGRVTALHMAALTNNPALDGMAALAAAKFTPTAEERQTMNEELKKLLGLDGEPSDEQIQAATAALAARLAEQDQQIAALKAKPAGVDPAKYVPVAAVEEIRQELATLKSEAQGRAVDELVGAALGDGRLLPAMEGWARDLGKKDLAALKNYVAQAQPIAALGGMQSNGRAPDNQPGQLSAEELAVCKQLGICAADFTKLKEEGK